MFSLTLLPNISLIYIIITLVFRRNFGILKNLKNPFITVNISLYTSYNYKLIVIFIPLRVDWISVTLIYIHIRILLFILYKVLL